MRTLIRTATLTALVAVALMSIGCDPTPPPQPKTVAVLPAPFTIPSTQPDEVVADMQGLQISRGELDDLLYKAYGLRMLFDLVELQLAKDTLKSEGQLMTSDDIDRERKSIIKGLVDPNNDVAEARYDDLFNQFLQNEHLSKAEFEVKIVQTNAYLRKIVTPLVVGKIPDAAVRRGFEQLYGAKRQIADIELENVREAVIARDRLNGVGKEAFGHVARTMSIDAETSGNGGLGEPFTSQSPSVPQAIRDAAFSMEKGEISDIIQADGKYHIIQLVALYDPKLVKYEDVKDDVRKQLENKLIELNIKKLRDELHVKAQQELRMDDPVLKGQWDEMIEQAQGKIHDRDSALQQMNADKAQAATQPATQP